jgi:hypothetical protein
MADEISTGMDSPQAGVVKSEEFKKLEIGVALAIQEWKSDLPWGCPLWKGQVLTNLVCLHFDFDRQWNWHVLQCFREEDEKFEATGTFYGTTGLRSSPFPSRTVK